MNAVSYTAHPGSTLWRSALPLCERRFGNLSAEAASRELVTATLAFLEELAGAKASSFLWIGSDCSIMEAQLRNVDEEQVTRYEAGIGEMDPLNVRRIKSKRCTVAILSADETHKQPVPLAYRRYLESCGLGDELALVLWWHNQPFAYVSLWRGLHNPPFSLAAHNWCAVHRYVEVSLSHHFRFRYALLEQCLTELFHLTSREIDVVELILQGKSNADISEILDISMATVKVHVGNILSKVGVDSRLAIANAVNQLQKL